MSRREPGLVSVVIPVRNGVGTLPSQIEAVARQSVDVPYEIIVVDNGSTDGTLELLEALVAADDRIRVVTAHQRPGVNVARNAGIRASAGELIVICDADDVVADGWLAAIVDAAAHGDLIGGALEVERLNPPAARAARPRPHPPNSLPVLASFLPYAVGANLAVWRDVVDDVGAFDESYAGGGDDVEFSFRVQLAGWRLVFAPDAVVHYRYREPAGAAGQAYAYGQSEPALYRRFREHGMPRGTVGGSLKVLARLLADLPEAVGREDRWLAWKWRVAHVLGRYRGCVRHRVLP